MIQACDKISAVAATVMICSLAVVATKASFKYLVNGDTGRSNGSKEDK